MAILWVIALLMLLATTASEARVFEPTLLEMATTQTSHMMQTTSVFEKGTYEITTITIRKSRPPSPPHPLLVVSPKTTGVYPIILFVHGTFLQNSDYSDLFQHIGSHGYIIVAPQLWSSVLCFPSQYDEIEMAASVANWLSKNLQDVLPLDVHGNLSKLAVSGHSRGGKTAFALALGITDTKLEIQISALIGVDPVAGMSKNDRTEPHILTYVPNSFNLSIPTMVIGSGLGNQSILPIVVPACAPNDVNYVDFFNECRVGTKFVLTNYGHMDMLNNNLGFMSSIASSACVKGNGRKVVARRTIGGLIVAFLGASFLQDPSDYINIIANPSLAPTRLYPVETKIQRD